jgi:predicted aspartyl protease
MSDQISTFALGTTASVALCLAGVLTAAPAHAATAACRAAKAPRQAFTMRVPFEVIDGRIYIQATVNDRGPFKFAVDTGASGLGRADTSLVSILGLKPEAPALNADGVKTAEAATVRIRSIAVGGLSQRDVRVITKDYSGRMSPESAFSGIVAREFFADGLLVIDYPRKLLSFSRTLTLSPGQKDVVSYERPFRVPISVGAITTEGNIDTGSNVTFVFPKTLFDRVSKAPLELAGTGQLANSKIDTWRSTVPGPIRIGGVAMSNAEVRVSAQFPELLVGAHALKNFTLLIDQRSKAVALCK